MRLFAATISAAIVLLFLSYLAIHQKIKRNVNKKKRREKLIGELQKSNEANEKLIKLRRNLIQDVTHELRTPLTAISGNAELLLNDTEADSRLRHAQTIHDAAGRMAEMINSLLVYFRLDSGKETPSVKPFKLCSIVKTLTTEFAPLAKYKGLDFKAEGETDEIRRQEPHPKYRRQSIIQCHQIHIKRHNHIKLRLYGCHIHLVGIGHGNGNGKKTATADIHSV